MCCNSAKANKTKTLNPNSIKNYFNNKSNTYAISNKFVVKSIIILLLWLFVFVMSVTMVYCISKNKGTLNEVDAVSGTAITTVEQLKAVANNLSGSYYLANDIIVNDNTWVPIGTSLSSNAFKGTFDGNGHTITFTQTIHITSNSGNVYGGLFGYVVGTSSTQKAEIKNLGVNWAGTGNVSISVGAENETYAGLVVSSSSIAYAGGIVGNVSSNAIISNCYNTGDVTATSTTSSAYAGGITGKASSSTIISNCYNTGSVSATGSSSVYAGGILGFSGTISNCYNTGEVSATSSAASSYSYAGGIVGFSDETISNCFSIGTGPSATGRFNYEGGIVGNSWTASCSYHNYGENYGNDTTNHTIIYNSNLANLVKQKSTFTGGGLTWNSSYPWDFEDTWAIDEKGVINGGYPYLKGFDFFKMVSFNITTNVGVIFNICDSESNILQSIYVSAGSSFTDTIPTFTYSALTGQSYKILISAPYTSNIQHTTVDGQQNLVGRVLYLTVNEEFIVTMNITGYLGGNSVVV